MSEDDASDTNSGESTDSGGRHRNSQDSKTAFDLQRPLRQAKIVFAENSFQKAETENASTKIEELLKQERRKNREEVVAMPYENVPTDHEDNISEHGDEVKHHQRRPAWMRWILVGVISCAVALQLSCMLLLEILFTREKFRFARFLYFGGHHTLSLGFLVLYALVAAGVSVFLVLNVSPHAQSSGIVDTKAYLNGHHIPGFLSQRAWFARSLALLLVTSAGLFAGTEGPLVGHLGAIISCGIARGRFKLCGRRFRLPWRLVGHRAQCEFVLIGTAMGMSAAFGSPLGGVLYSMEFVSSTWRNELTLLVFVGSVLAAFIAKVCKSGFTFPLSNFVEFPDNLASFQPWELVPFMCIGALTGLLGALFCKGSGFLGKLRATVFTKAKPRKNLRLAEVLLHSAAVVIMSSTVPVAMGCRDLDAVTTVQGDWHIGTHVRGFCPVGQYTDVGTLLLQPKHEAVKALFTKHFEGDAYFTVESLIFTYFLIYGFTLLASGMAMPAGLFVPQMMAGACLGRAVAQVISDVSGNNDIHPGVYALVGAAGQLAGVVRLPLSLTLVLVEITSNVRLILPLMSAIMVSKAVADRFTPSVFDVTIGLKPQFQMLEGEWKGSDDIIVHDICSRSVVALRCRMQLGHIILMLAEAQYQAFPVVEGQQSHVVGVVNRSALLCLVEKMRGEMDSTVVDLTTLADLAPETKHWTTPVARTFRDFVSMGLRQLCIVDSSHGLCGILTRTDLCRLCNPKGLQTIRESVIQQFGAGKGDFEGDVGNGVIPVSPLTKENLSKLADLEKRVSCTEALSKRITAVEAELEDLRPLRAVRRNLEDKVADLQQQMLCQAFQIAALGRGAIPGQLPSCSSIDSEAIVGREASIESSIVGRDFVSEDPRGSLHSNESSPSRDSCGSQESQASLALPSVQSRRHSHSSGAAPAPRLSINFIDDSQLARLASLNSRATPPTSLSSLPAGGAPTEELNKAEPSDCYTPGRSATGTHNAGSAANLPVEEAKNASSSADVVVAPTPDANAVGSPVLVHTQLEGADETVVSAEADTGVACDGNVDPPHVVTEEGFDVLV